MQRLFGVSLVLGSEHALSEEARKRCASECTLRSPTFARRSRPLAPPSLDTGATLREELAPLGRHYKDLPLELHWDEGVEVPDDVEALAQSVLAEALRNAHKHARPSSSACTWDGWMARSCSRFATTARARVARRPPAWGCALPRSRRFSAARWWSSGRRDRLARAPGGAGGEDSPE